MTSVLNFNTDSSSTNLTDTPIASLSKKTSTFIIQPPSSTNTSALLAKRTNSSHLGDLLMKKFKPQTANTSETNSNQQSPMKGLADAIYDTSDNQSNPENEFESPAVDSFDATDKLSTQNLIPQRSLSTFSLKLNRTNSQSSHKQILNALDLLQKRLVEYQVMNLRDTLLKATLLQGNLVIPALNAQSSTATSSNKMNTENKKPVQQDDEDEPEVYYGEVQYPLLHLAPKAFQVVEESKNAKVNNKVKASKAKKGRKISNLSSPAEEDNSLLESLTATRAGTQRSEPEMIVNLKELTEKIADIAGKKGKKANKNEEKTKEAVHKNKKGQKKEKKTKGREESLLSPVSKGKKMTERRKNKWQLHEEEVEAQAVF